MPTIVKYVTWFVEGEKVWVSIELYYQVVGPGAADVTMIHATRLDGQDLSPEDEAAILDTADLYEDACLDDWRANYLTGPTDPREDR